MDTVAIDLTGWRNAPFPSDPDEVDGEWLSFEDGGEAIDLTGKTFALDVRAVAGTGTALISLDTTTSTSANGVRVIDAAAAKIVIQIAQASMQSAWDAAYAAGLMKAGQAAPLVYDLRVTDADGFAEVWLEGAFIINPGITL